MTNLKMLAFVSSLLLIAACNSSKVVQKAPPSEVPTVETTDKKPLEATLIGKWTITRFSAFSPKLPKYNPGDIIYEFSDLSNMMKVTRKESVPETTPSYPSGSYNYITNNCLLHIDEKMFFYEIKVTETEDKSETITLVLDTNTDPSISNDGPVYFLTKIQ